VTAGFRPVPRTGSGDPSGTIVSDMALLAGVGAPVTRRLRQWTVSGAVDNLFFVIAGPAAFWLAYLVLRQGLGSGWTQVWFYLLFWLVLAYIALPRLHRMLTTIYVPNYFIGRTRTSDGLLGDPVNLAFLGAEEQLHEALLEARWTRAEDVSLRSAWRIVWSTVLRQSYDEAPVSPLMLFGRNQDFAYQQEVLGNPAKRHHVRFWRCPDGWLLPGGHRVDWLAAGTYDRAVGFSLFTLQVTHKIDANTDVERDHIVATLQAADAAMSLTVLESFATGYHARNGGGDAILTDGNLPVVDLRQVAVTAPAKAMTAVPVPTPQSSGARSGAPDKAVRRPVQTVFGAAVVLLRAVTPFLVILGAALGWGGLQDLDLVNSGGVRSAAGGLDGVTSSDLVTAGTVLLFDGVLGLLVLLGSELARLTVMALSTASIVLSAVNRLAAGTAIDLATNLLALSLDILILVALSSPTARNFARQPRDRKAARVAISL
jgi:hypothetical protein